MLLYSFSVQHEFRWILSTIFPNFGSVRYPFFLFHPHRRTERRLSYVGAGVGGSLAFCFLVSALSAALSAVCSAVCCVCVATAAAALPLLLRIPTAVAVDFDMRRAPISRHTRLRGIRSRRQLIHSSSRSTWGVLRSLRAPWSAPGAEAPRRRECLPPTKRVSIPRI